MTTAFPRLVIGITGHRQLAEPEHLAAKIDAVIDEIVRQAAFTGSPRQVLTGDKTPPLRLVVLSPLAEGADRLVAERVLSLPGSELEVVLPLEETDYEADFADEASKEEFRSFLARAKTVHRLPGSADRKAAYAAAGRFVVDHCDVLIAVWDGRPGDGPGGTADAVAYARSRTRRLSIIEP